MELLTADEMRAIETEAIDAGRITGIDLMERAGRAVVEAIFEEWPELDRAGRSDLESNPAPSPTSSAPGEATVPRRAVVLCGPGNNGGDGFVIARLLHERGWEVEVFLYGEADKLPPDARTNCDLWRQIGRIGAVSEDFDTHHGLRGAALAIDALFGTGLTRPLEDLSDVLSAFCEAADAFAQGKPGAQDSGFATRVVAVDMPSGIHTDTGRALAPSHGGCAAARANLTVTFHRAKCGHMLGDGPDASGKLVVMDIGL